MFRAIAVVPVGLLGAWTLAAGCAASGSDQRLNGPSYDLDASGATEDASDGARSSSAPDASKALDAAPHDATAAPEAAALDDAGADGAVDSGSADDAGSCRATTVLLGGNDFSLFGAVATGAGSLATQTLTGSVAQAPALVAFGGGFEALVAEAIDSGMGDALYGVALTGGAWSAPTPLGGSASAIDAPALAAVGATLQGAYLNPSHQYFHASFATAWDTGADPVRPADASVTAFGPVRAAAAGTATDFVIAYEGNDLHPYAQTCTIGAGWDDGVALGAAVALASTPMSVVALGGGGASDLLAVYVDGEGSGSGNNLHLFFVTRSAAQKTWSAPAMVNANAFTQGAPALTAMSGGRALLAWLGQSGGIYASVLDAGVWSTPAAITSATPSSTPALAPGVCGDDAVAAYLSAGTVYTTHFASGAWTSPAALVGASGVTSVAIATSL